MNLRMKSITVLKADGKYANRPLERLTIVDKDTNEKYVIDAYCEDVSFIQSGKEIKMIERYTVKDIKSKNIDYDITTLINDVYDEEHVHIVE